MFQFWICSKQTFVLEHLPALQDFGFASFNRAKDRVFSRWTAFAQPCYHQSQTPFVIRPTEPACFCLVCSASAPELTACLRAAMPSGLPPSACILIKRITNSGHISHTSKILYRSIGAMPVRIAIAVAIAAHIEARLSLPPLNMPDSFRSFSACWCTSPR